MTEGDGDLAARLRGALAPQGLNLVGATSVATYDALVEAPYRLGRLAPGARGVLVVGNGGGAFWQAVRDACRGDPGLAADPDPVDTYTRRIIEAALPKLGGGPHRVVYPFRFAAEPVSFRTLGECAGLGRRSLLGLLVHPVFGPWMALRAALLVPEPVTAARPADGFDPCPGCVERACIAACPAGAVSAAGWDVPRCVAWRQAPDDPCAARCHARFDCVLGREHRPPAEAMAYHQWRAR